MGNHLWLWEAPVPWTAPGECSVDALLRNDPMGVHSSRTGWGSDTYSEHDDLERCHCPVGPFRLERSP